MNRQQRTLRLVTPVLRRRSIPVSRIDATKPRECRRCFTTGIRPSLSTHEGCFCGRGVVNSAGYDRLDSSSVQTHCNLLLKILLCPSPRAQITGPKEDAPPSCGVAVTILLPTTIATFKKKKEPKRVTQFPLSNCSFDAHHAQGQTPSHRIDRPSTNSRESNTGESPPWTNHHLGREEEELWADQNVQPLYIVHTGGPGRKHARSHVSWHRKRQKKKKASTTTTAGIYLNSEERSRASALAGAMYRFRPARLLQRSPPSCDPPRDERCDMVGCIRDQPPGRVDEVLDRIGATVGGVRIDTGGLMRHDQQTTTNKPLARTGLAQLQGSFT